MELRSGKSTIKLVIAVLAIIVTVIVVANYVVKTLNKEKIKEVQADLLLVQAKVNIVKGSYNVNKDENPLKGYQLNQLPENININEFLEKHIIPEEEYEKYYLIDNAALEKMELQELINKYDGYFIVNYDNFEVIYTKGYENESGMWCYKLTDLHKKPEIKLEKNNNQENGEENNQENQSEDNNQEQSQENNEGKTE